MATLATDTFTRTVTGGWGSADTGQVWTALAATSGMSVNGTEAVNTHTSAERIVAGKLGITPALNLDVTAVWSLDVIPTGGVAGPRLFARYVDATNDYHARILAAADTGAITVGLYRGDAAVITASVSTGVSLTAGTKIRSRVQALGSSPTTIKAKVWLDGATEPDWQITGTDSTAAMQVAAVPGIRIGLAGGTATPLTSRIDSFVATDGVPEDPATGNIGAHLSTSPAVDSATVGAVVLKDGLSVTVVRNPGPGQQTTPLVIDAGTRWGTATFPGLAAGSTHSIAFDVAGVRQTDAALTVRTLPSGPTSFVMATGSCQFTGSNHPVFDAIRGDNPVMLAHMGDLHYGDATTATAWRTSVEASLSAARMRTLLEAMPMTWTWDNHDRIIANAGGGGLPLNYGTTDPLTNTQWRYLAGSSGWASSGTTGRTWAIGRVRFIQTDQWTVRDDPDAGGAAPYSFLGAAQKQWFKDTLAAATEPVIVWLCQWTGQNYTNGRWDSFPDETAELEAWINARPEVKAKMVMIGGDSHSLQVTDGSRTLAQGQRFAGIPNYNISGFNRSGDTATGNPGWLVDAALRTSAQPEADWGGYSRITVTDAGDDLTFKWEAVRVGPTGTTDIMDTRTLIFAAPSPQPWETMYAGGGIASAVYVGSQQVWP